MPSEDFELPPAPLSNFKFEKEYEPPLPYDELDDEDDGYPFDLEFDPEYGDDEDQEDTDASL